MSVQTVKVCINVEVQLQLINGFNTVNSRFTIYIYKRLCPRKKIRNRKKERATETLNLKFNTKPLKFKWGLADGGGGAGWSTHARHGYPHLVII
jgi:hypothetical protein